MSPSTGDDVRRYSRMSIQMVPSESMLGCQIFVKNKAWGVSKGYSAVSVIRMLEMLPSYDVLAGPLMVPMKKSAGIRERGDGIPAARLVMKRGSNFIRDRVCWVSIIFHAWGPGWGRLNVF